MIITQKQLQTDLEAALNSYFESGSEVAQLSHDYLSMVDIEAIKEQYPLINDKHVTDAAYIAWVISAGETPQELLRSEATWFIVLLGLVGQIPLN